MNKKVKKAFKTIEKYEKKKKAKASRLDFRMYETAGCSNCSDGQKYSVGGDATSVTYYDRCVCANKETENYKIFIKKKDKLMSKLSAKDFLSYSCKWYDNNSHITVGNNAVDRSW